MIFRAIIGLLLILHVQSANSILVVSDYFFSHCMNACCEEESTTCDSEEEDCCSDNCHVVNGIPLLINGTLTESIYTFVFSLSENIQISWFKGDPISGYTQDNLRPPHLA